VKKAPTRSGNALSCGEFRGESKKQRPPGGSFGKGLAVALESHGHDGGVTRTRHIGIGCWFQQSVMVSREAAAPPGHLEAYGEAAQARAVVETNAGPCPQCPSYSHVPAMTGGKVSREAIESGLY
jgi:hypothetical protein